MMIRGLFLLVSFVGLLRAVDGQTRRPNFIVMQPDDLEYFEEWLPPAHFPRSADATFRYNTFGLPNLDRLRNRGLHLRQAYTSSPMCGTSRYSTMTGKYPSRSSRSRSRNTNNPISTVSIPTTKLMDVNGVVDGNDCSRNNLAAFLAENGYRTGVTGKWHLAPGTETYNYDTYTAGIRECGFDFAEAIYAENLNNGFFQDGTFSHNLEHIADQAVSFIRDNQSEPFFLYVNPTAPHSSGDVLEALTEYSCRDTPSGRLASDPVIPGMTEESGGCAAYRQTILDRAGNQATQNTLGAIWVDDVVGSLFRALEDTNQLDNTFFLFQLDHGNEGKGTLWEPGVRIAQFVHYPDAFGSSGTMWDGLVSTVDIGATILDFAGVGETSPGYYDMDGVSWKNAVLNPQELPFWRDERCLAFEIDTDRAVRCGCFKYMSLETIGATYTRSNRFGVVRDTEILLDICNGGDIEIGSPGNSREATDVSGSNPVLLSQLSGINQAHVDRTVASRSPLDFSPLQSYPMPMSPSPVSAPSLSPSRLPTKNPTPASPPTSGPTRSPTSGSPTTGDVSSPVSSPTESPTDGSQTTPDSTLSPASSPTESPTDESQTAPETLSPASSPPTKSPTGTSQTMTDPPSPESSPPTKSPTGASQTMTDPPSPESSPPTKSPTGGSQTQPPTAIVTQTPPSTDPDPSQATTGTPNTLSPTVTPVTQTSSSFQPRRLVAYGACVMSLLLSWS